MRIGPRYNMSCYDIVSFNGCALQWVERFWRFALKLPIHSPFWGVFGGYFPHMTSPIILIPQKALPWAA